MKCSRAQKYLSDYLAENLSDSRYARVEKHLRDCTECRKYLERMQKTIRILNELPTVSAPVDFLEKIHSAGAQGTQESLIGRITDKLFKPMKFKIPAQIAAMAIIAVIILHVVTTEDMKKANLSMEPGRIATHESAAPKQALPEAAKRAPRALPEAEKSKPSGDMTSTKEMVSRQKEQRKATAFSEKAIHLTLTLKSQQEPSPPPRALLDSARDDIYEKDSLGVSGSEPAPKSRKESEPKQEFESDPEPESQAKRKPQPRRESTDQVKTDAIGKPSPFQPDALTMKGQRKLGRVAELIAGHDGELLSSRQKDSSRFQIRFRLPTRQLFPLLERFATLGTIEHSPDQPDMRGQTASTVVVLTIEEGR